MTSELPSLLSTVALWRRLEPGWVMKARERYSCHGHPRDEKLVIFGKATLLHGVEMSHSPVYEQDLIYNLNGHGYIAWTALEAGHLPEHAFSRNVYFSNRFADPSALSRRRKI